MQYTKLKNINKYKSENINPAKTPDTVFEMYSVPIYETGHPEYLRGSQIASNKAVVEKNDILVCKINPRINRVWIVSDESDNLNIASSEWIVVRNNEYNPEFLAWYFRTPRFQKLMTSEVTGIGGSLTRAQPKSVAEYPVPVLDRNTQNEIVARLNKCKIIIDSKEQELEQLDTLVKSRFAEMFGDISDDEKKTMADICTIITDGTHQPPKFVSEGIPFLFVSNIVTNEISYDTQKFISEETYAKLIKRTPIEIGDILLSTVGSYGHPAVVKKEKPFCFQRHIAYLKPNADMVDSEYLRGAILSADVQRQIDEGVKGIAQKTLNLSEIRKIKLPLPPIDRQKQFAAFVAQTDKSK
ncbi:restriction endonuclease subunit S [Hominisplanchenecus sp.]|uniref:restriction endonuclease subunit S n=1 Tax=Hominisplanchenecus sp. TaxID=3038130 RepID=UPI003991855E